ncbi:uncharacterized protein [Spinacia oleracea]|uniref:Proliferating cell nuclear antigen PCNA N-terminal domain-containing protein n=1 Tax=Spinacia oleracea TaxID=3562 RepID=A0ABM3RP80_SPIOL|nr:uncharacterized protein LOC130471378 [Spinacia oleracea]
MRMNLNYMSTMFKCAGNDDIITIKDDDASDKVNFVFESDMVSASGLVSEEVLEIVMDDKEAEKVVNENEATTKVKKGTNIQEFDLEIRDKKVAENVVADHMSRLRYDDAFSLLLSGEERVFLRPLGV